MKILVLGWYYSPNLGDAVLNECTASLLRLHFPQAQIVIRDLIGRQSFPIAAGTGIQRFHSRCGQVLYKTLTRLGCWNQYLVRHRADLDRIAAEDCNMVVFAGGQLFMDSLAIYIYDLTERFAARDIPVFFNACGMGPSRGSTVRKRLAQALQRPNVKYCSCRDNVALLNRCCGREVAVFAGDPALWADKVFDISKDPQAKTVGLGILLPNSLPPKRVLAFWRRLIRTMERRRIPWKLFTNGAPTDMAFARQLLGSMPELNGSEAAYLCPAPKTPEELVQLIAGFGSLIAFRLHSHIIAAALDIPSVALLWDDKLLFFFDKLGRPERCLTIDAPPEGVLAALVQARLEGIDRPALEIQRQDAARQLLEAMDETVNRGLL